MIVTEKRRLELKQMPVKRVRQLCGPDRDSGWPSHGTVRNVTGGHQPADGMALTFMKAAAAVLAWDNAAAKRVIVKHLIRFARKGGLSRLRGEIDANTYYNLDRTLLPIIVSYSFVRDDPTLKSKDRERIEAWLDGLVRMRGPNRVVDPMRISSRNNHRYLRDSVTMAWGALIGDDTLFREGIRRFTIALGQMRDDGSLPLETDRGQLALFYQRHAIASLVAIAEMAATQGYDLYTKTNSRGGRLDDMIGFLARGVTDPSVLERYTLEPQDLSFLVERGHDRHYMSWLEAYAARFPDDDNVRLLRDAMKRLGARQGERLDDYSGGMTSCFFATNSTID
ncbi:MAG: alginate lyase family protein [Geminicoccaceae bacterium]|nr:alginate lyase family protein [Geminicoccaceae bacterium]MCB9942663.1 alginate lyase family protein [Geminicoccaceae bacterium]